jgi:hypothetical protein
MEMRTMLLLDEVLRAWGWTGVAPATPIDENDFGNLICRMGADVTGDCAPKISTAKLWPVTARNGTACSLIRNTGRTGAWRRWLTRHVNDSGSFLPDENTA